MNGGKYDYAVSRDFLGVRIIAQGVDPAVILMVVVLRLISLVLLWHPANCQETVVKAAEAGARPPWCLLPLAAARAMT